MGVGDCRTLCAQTGSSTRNDRIGGRDCFALRAQTGSSTRNDRGLRGSTAANIRTLSLSKCLLYRGFRPRRAVSKAQPPYGRERLPRHQLPPRAQAPSSLTRIFPSVRGVPRRGGVFNIKGFGDSHTSSAIKKAPLRGFSRQKIGGGIRIRTGDGGFADLCLTTWPCRPIVKQKTDVRPVYGQDRPFVKKAGDEI